MEIQSDDIIQLQNRLLHLMETVDHRRSEDPILRAEILVTMNLLCSEELLITLWSLLDDVDTRQEMLLVRLLVDIAPERVEEASKVLLKHLDPEIRSIGYGVLALHSTPKGAQILLDALKREPGVVLRRGGERKLAPYSFSSSMLAGMREFKSPLLDDLVVQSLERFSKGEDSFDILKDLLNDKDPTVAQLGFVALASRVMGRVHRAAYESVVCAQRPPLLDHASRDWLTRALETAPEIIEVICDSGPPRLDTLAFIRARVQVLKEMGDDCLTRLCDRLLQGKQVLPSMNIEGALHPRDRGALPAKKRRRARGLAYLIGLLMEYRPVLAEMVEKLDGGGDLELAAVEQMLMLGGDGGAFNLATALIGHWFSLDENDPEQGPLWRWIDSLWRDDRHLHISDAVVSALYNPDETSTYAAQLLSAVRDRLGKGLKFVGTAEPLMLSHLLLLSEEPRWIPALRAHLRAPNTQVHSQTIMAIARIGMSQLKPALQMRRQAMTEESPERGALDFAQRILEAHQVAMSQPEIKALKDLHLQMFDQRFESAERARERLLEEEPQHPLLPTLAEPDAQALLQLFFCSSHGQQDPRERLLERSPILRAELVLDLTNTRALRIRWLHGDGTPRSAPPMLIPAPAIIDKGFMGLPWNSTSSHLEEALKTCGGALHVLVPREGIRARARAVAHLQKAAIRVELDVDGRLFRGLRSTNKKTPEEAIKAMEKHYGPPTLRNAQEILWCFPQTTVTLVSDPGLGPLCEQVTRSEEPPSAH